MLPRCTREVLTGLSSDDKWIFFFLIKGRIKESNPVLTQHGFLGHGQLYQPLACSARATSARLCARPVSLCIAAAAAARVICACVRREREHVCVCARTAISREQGPNKLSLIPTPLAGTDTKCSESRAHARARTLSASASLSMPPCLPVFLFLSLSLVEAVGFVKSTDRTWKGKQTKKPTVCSRECSPCISPSSTP